MSLASNKSDDSTYARDVIALLAPPKSPGEIGRLGPYPILKLLGSGGMGAVFLAQDEQLQRQIAIKVMKPGLAASPEERHRFLREARAVAALNNDNIVKIYHVGGDHGSPWLAMELLEGESLKTRLDQHGRLDVLEAVKIGRQIAEALAAAHLRGLIHRDIKPENVWLEMANAPRKRSAGVSSPKTSVAFQDETAPLHECSAFHWDRVKVLDFGLARLDSDDVQITRSGFIVGTPGYMAPEQARGDDVDARCDLFSLGCVMYRMLAGFAPFRGKDTMAVLAALATHTPPPIGDQSPDIPAALSDLIAKLVAKEPEFRPSSADQIAKSLAVIEIACAKSSTPNPNPVDPVAATMELASTTELFPSRRKPYRHAIFLAMAATVICGTLGIVAFFQPPRGEIVVELGDGVPADDVKIEVEGNGELKTADPRSGWRISTREGTYNVHVEGATDRFDIDQNIISVRPREATRVKVTLKPTNMTANDVTFPNASSPRDSRLLGDSQRFVTKPNPTTASEHWLSLFNGTDTRSLIFKDNGGRPWMLDHGLLVGGPAIGNETVTMTSLQSSFKNFHLRLEANMTGELLGWVVVRVTNDRNDRRYRVRLGSGDLIFQTKSKSGPRLPQRLQGGQSLSVIKAGEWFSQEVIAIDDEITVIVNQKEILRYQDRSHHLPSGAVAVSCGKGTTMQVRKVEIKELP